MKKFAISTSVEGRDIPACRDRLALTQAEFAKLAGVSKRNMKPFWKAAVFPGPGTR